MGSKELVDGVRHYRERLESSCVYCGKPHHPHGMYEMCKHCDGTC